MHIFTKKNELIPHLAQLRANGLSIGFVPTMGALHEGHLSLLAAAKKATDITVCSIFVNPTQFTDPSDLLKYPRPIAKDTEMLESAGCTILYLPTVEDVYGDNTNPTQSFQFDNVDTLLEGASRPGHFAGVAQVVSILLAIVQPQELYLGQKDYQQCIIIKLLIKQLNLHTAVVVCPIIREETGLAMSSRNIRLSDTLRKQAGLIYATLQYAALLLPNLTDTDIEKIAVEAINTTPNFEVDYFKILDADTLKPATIETKSKVLITAILTGGVRLLDNMVVQTTL